MSATEVSATCVCGSLLPELVQCPDHRRYFKSGIELVSVTKMIRETYPIKPSWDGVDMSVVEHARNRGILVDAMVCQWLEGQPVRVPKGTPTDVIDEGKIGFYAVAEWWNSQPRPKVRTQVMLSGDDTAGTPDILTDDEGIWDLKVVARPESTFGLQLGGYAELAGGAAYVGLIHCKFSKGGTVATVNPILYDVRQCVDDFQTLRAMYRLVKRLTPGRVSTDKGEQ